MAHDAASTPSPPVLGAFVSQAELAALVARALDEDLGPDRVDATSECFIPADATASGQVRARRAGVLAGGAMLSTVVGQLDPALRVELHATDADALRPGQTIATMAGSLRSILAIERTALNFLTHLSGIATLTARFVAATAGTKARIFDTRKTLPGWRRLQKYAVACGGGHNHRMGLFDAVLIKDNHLAYHAPSSDEPLSERVRRAMAVARHRRPAPRFVEIEVDTLEQLEQVLPAGANAVLLDNMAVEALREAVAMRDRVAPDVELEASGGVTLDNVAAVAATGVDRIAVGALTHSAAALDIGLDLT